MTPKDMISCARKLGDNELGVRMENDSETLRRVRKLANDCAWYGRLHLSDEVRAELGITVETPPSVRIPTFTKTQGDKILRFKVTPFVSQKERQRASAEKRQLIAQGVADRKAVRASVREAKMVAKAQAREAKEANVEDTE